jgi:hypothetical protein
MSSPNDRSIQFSRGQHELECQDGVASKRDVVRQMRDEAMSAVPPAFQDRGQDRGTGNRSHVDCDPNQSPRNGLP